MISQADWDGIQAAWRRFVKAQTAAKEAQNEYLEAKRELNLAMIGAVE